MTTQAELEELAADYAVSLQDLTFNSKPIINMLTTIAQENIAAARPIARVLEEHIAKVS
ncbi:FKBP12-associated protein [Savitreella phatthalungensis]